jgi:hypothetical protein
VLLRNHSKFQVLFPLLRELERVEAGVSRLLGPLFIEMGAKCRSLG